jgi:hypothetical protein
LHEGWQGRQGVSLDEMGRWTPDGGAPSAFPRGLAPGAPSPEGLAPGGGGIASGMYHTGTFRSHGMSPPIVRVVSLTSVGWGLD